MTTSAPSSANKRAVAFPIPEVAPVTNATFLLRILSAKMFVVISFLAGYSLVPTKQPATLSFQKIYQVIDVTRFRKEAVDIQPQGPAAV